MSNFSEKKKKYQETRFNPHSQPYTQDPGRVGIARMPAPVFLFQGLVRELVVIAMLAYIGSIGALSFLGVAP